MARVVLIVDSSTGTLIDVAGNGREGGRYKKFAKRLLSSDTNPVLDYGGNGGDTLTISKSGGKGSEIKLMADTVTIPSQLTVGGKTIAEIAAAQSTGVLDNVMGTENEISVTEITLTDSSSGETSKGIQISLDESVVGKLDMIEAALGGMSKFVLKSDIATVIADLKVEDDDTLEDVKGTLRVMLARLNALVGGSSSSSSSSSSPSV